MTTNVDKAMRIYKLWTEKEPDNSSLWEDQVQELTVDWDKLELQLVGTAKDILYTSDKWEKPGVLERYHHAFDSNPGVYVKAGRDGDAGAVPSVAKLCGVRSLKAPLALTLIAVVNELVIKRPGAPHLTFRFPHEPAPLCSTLDKQGLVILSRDRGPIFIRGGRMRVTKDGIVG